MSSSVSSPAIAPEGLEQLNALWKSFDDVKSALSRINEVGGEDAKKRADKIANKIDSFEPTITLIGQIKAGKTALINSMVGQTDLLPSDVNPWTSVVTSLHLNSRRRPEGTKALFQFFDEEEWDRLVSTGGRLGELAQRAGFGNEKDAIQAQVVAMREKSRARLGKKFEMLLGTSHNYDMIDQDLINRYVCYGAWEDEEETNARGRFADITKLANLYLDLPGYPTGLCLRDTPGVNDTFMMREQITINSIRDSRLCIVVLSAHQALSTMDMALLRLIANVDAREVVLFVNRIDELDDPANEIPEIEKNFRQTLKKHDVAEDVQIVFGSAFWALNAISDTLENLPDASSAAMEKWAQSDLCDDFLTNYEGLRGLAWNLSGVPTLHRCIADRIIQGPGQAMLKEVRDEVGNLLTSIETADREIGIRRESATKTDIDEKALKAKIKEVEKRLTNSLSDASEFARDELSERLTRSQGVFADRAVEALLSHLEAHGSDEVWQYNPAGLRMMLRSAYSAFGAAVEKSTQDVFHDACRSFEDIYVDAFGVEPGAVRLNAPATARLLPPTTVGQTIALDLNVSWWKKWWRNLLGPNAATERYSELVLKETSSIVSELSEEMAPALCAENAAILKEFMETQRDALISLASDGGEESSAADTVAPSEKAEALDHTRKLIENLAA